MKGRKIGPYEIEDTLGQGGMGVVYKAVDAQLGRPVALKFLTGDALADTDAKARFLQEARAAAALDHPHICGVYQISEDDGQVYIAMPFLEGQGLDRKIAAGPLPLAEAVEIAVQIADALEEAHKKEIVHRDLKPANVIVGDRGRGRLHAVLMDFGLARLANVTRLTREGRQMGTAAYMSPEQVMGSSVDGRTDLWSLGVVLYEMTAGSTPFPAEYEQALFYAIQNEDPEPLTALRSGVPMELERITFKCMAKDPAQRYQTATDLLVDLNNLKAELETGKSRVRPSSRGQSAPPTAPVEPNRESRPDGSPAEAPATTSPGALAAAAVVGAGLASLGAWLFLGAGAAPRTGPVDYEIRRATWDGRLSSFPALSPDGDLLAYSSDRAGNGDLDIWVQQVDGGGLVRLTDTPEDESYAVFSPDGTEICFTRTGVGLFTIPAIGGEPYLVASGAVAGSYSPDGKMLAYVREGSEAGGAFYQPVSMGEPVRAFAGLDSHGTVIWSPDGSKLIARGRNDEGVADWWAWSIEDGGLTALNAAAAFRDAGFSFPTTGMVRRVGRTVVLGGGGEIYRASISSDGTSIGKLERLTFGAGLEALPTASEDGRVAFMNARQRRDMWSIEVDARSGGSAGRLQRLTLSEASDSAGHVSPDGKQLVWISDRWGSRDLWTRTLPDGAEVNLSLDAAQQRRPLLSPDGDRVVYLVREDDKDVLYVRPVAGGAGRTLCADCGVPRSWSPDGKYLLYEKNRGTYALEVGGAPAETPLFGEADQSALQAAFSPDGTWVAFRTTGDSYGLRIAPFRGAETVPSSEWVTVNDDDSASFPAWSANSLRLFYYSKQSGSTDIWSQSLNASGKTPSGDPVVVKSFPRQRHSLSLIQTADQALVYGGGRLFFPMSELDGEIWIMEPRSDDAADE